MEPWIYVYLLLLVVLASVAIYEHRSTTTLSLPLSPALTILTILLPLFSFANTLAVPAISSGASRHRTPLVTNLLQLLPLLQLVLSVVLSTFFFSAVSPSAVRSCLLSTTWQRLFATKDGAALRRVQDAFNCCGFNSVRDRAWPFAEDLRGGGGAPCAERFGRSLSCAGPWTAVLQRNAGVDGGIALAVTVLQVVIFLLTPWLTSRRQGGWSRLLGSFTGAANGDAAVARPLLEGGEEHADDTNDGNVAEEGQPGQSGQRPPRDNYGSTGSRVEPSFRADNGEPNEWATEH